MPRHDPCKGFSNPEACDAAAAKQIFAQINCFVEDLGDSYPKFSHMQLTLLTPERIPMWVRFAVDLQSQNSNCQ
jgi:hypothetical protein